MTLNCNKDRAIMYDARLGQLNLAAHEEFPPEPCLISQLFQLKSMSFIPLIS
jgi:hypothetical protein